MTSVGEWLSLVKARRQIRLGELLGHGGEGSVYTVTESPNIVAKIYSKGPSAEKVQKLLRMAETVTPAILKVAAWPTDLVARGIQVVGFVMPRIVARRDIHELYSPKSRSMSFPEADFSFLVHVGSNVCRAFAMVHEYGHVVGDVNHGNILVSPDGTVILIDCDSFQIGAGSAGFTCDVGVPLFTPPELHGRALRGQARTQNHDRFGLAILLFHLLFMGRHPFAGRYLGNGDMPIERAIAESRFAYGQSRAGYQMDRPPGTADLNVVGPKISNLFERAFSRSGIASGRPAAKEWLDALEHFKHELRECNAASWHHYCQTLSECPWCRVEATTGTRLFGQRIKITRTAGLTDLQSLWSSLQSVTHPAPEPALPSTLPWKPPPGVELPRTVLRDTRRVASAILMLGALVIYGTLTGAAKYMPSLVLIALGSVIWPRVPAEKRQEVQREVADAEAGWKNVLERWNREASNSAFAQQAAVLARAYAQIQELPNERARRIAALEVDRMHLQRAKYLDRFRIDKAKIRGVGTERTMMLAAFGIETALDVEERKIRQVSGFGPKLTRELLEWRAVHERNFKFNPGEPIDPATIAALDRELEGRRQAWYTELRQGVPRLHAMSAAIPEARVRLAPSLRDAWDKLQLARARLEAL